MKTKMLDYLASMIILGLALGDAHAMTNAITYQGRLTDQGAPADGSYDLQFTLFDAATNGSVVAGPITNLSVNISGGLFTVALDFGGGIFDGNDRWVEIAGRTNGVGGFGVMTPRQLLTPSPYAIIAGQALAAATVTGVLPSGGLSGTYSGALTLNNTANQFNGSFSGNGGSVSNVNAVTLSGLSANNFWNTSGNAGTSAGANFIGTTDNQAFEVKVNGNRALRIEPNGSSPNLISGAAANNVSLDAVGATISGGGFDSAGESNAVYANFATIGGGSKNENYADYGTIAGGYSIRIGTNSWSTSIGGGIDNQVGTNSIRSTIAGGSVNTIGDNQTSVTISGGTGNAIDSQSSYAAIGGGQGNHLSTNSSYGVIGGGGHNLIEDSLASTIAGGYENMHDTTVFSAISGGRHNTMTNASWTYIGGGEGNTAKSNANYSAIGAGLSNSVVGEKATIPGGHLNLATNLAFAAGNRAKAAHTGSFVWADSTDADFTTTGNNQFLIRASGNVGINKNNPGTTLDVNGFVGATGFIGNLAGNASSATTAANFSGSLVGDVTGTQGATAVAAVGGQTAANIANGADAANAATSVPTGNTIVKRDASGNFSAGSITAAQLLVDAGTASGPALGINGDPNTGLFAPAADTIALTTGGAERLRVTSAGRLGVGVANPSKEIEVQKSGDVQIGLQSADTDGHLWTIQSSATGNSVNDASFQIVDRSLNVSRLTIQTNGNIGIGITPTNKFHVNGGISAIAFVNTSDRNAKENFAPVSPREVLDKVSLLPISTWNFKEMHDGRHMGPMAQDFYAAFGLGGGDTTITSVDPDGVALAAIQGLNQKLTEEVKEKEKEIRDLKQELQSVKEAVAKLVARESNRSTR